MPVLYEVLSITVELHCKRPLCNAMPTYLLCITAGHSYAALTTGASLLPANR